MTHSLTAIDFSPISNRVMAQAEVLARTTECPLTLLHVAAPNPGFIGYEAGPQEVRDARAHELRKEHQLLTDRATDLQQKGIDARPALVEGATVATILRQAVKLHASYIVIGSHGHGALYSALLGSVSSGVIAGTLCPVVVVPHRTVDDDQMSEFSP